MGSIQLLLGKSRRRRRRALPGEHLSGVDGRGRPTFLYVTDTQRKKAVVEREFLDWRKDRPVFAPRVRVLTEVFEDLWLRHGDGRALLPPRVGALVAERLLANEVARWPWLASLGGGPVVGEALASLHTRLAEAGGVGLDGIPHEAELREALRAYEGRVRGLSGWIHPAEALQRLLIVVEAPPASLVQWLRSTHSVVIDDVLQPSALRRSLLVALCRAWEAAGTHVVVAFETGRDLGGREAEAFFEYGEVDDVALPLKPLTATRELRKALFEAVIGEGDGRILLARRDEVRPIEPGEVPDDPEEPDLVDLVYAGGTVPVATREEARSLLLGRVRLVRCDDPEAELVAIARDVKRALLDGERPGDCVVALPDLEHYAPAVRAVFDDHGIPHALAAGARLAHSPVCNLVRQSLRIALDGWPSQALLALAGSDLVERPADVDPIGLRQSARGAGLGAGRPSSWEEPLRAWERRVRRSAVEGDLAVTLGWLEALCEGLAPLGVDAEPAAWRAALLGALDRLGVAGRIGQGDDGRVVSDNLEAWGVVLDTIDRVVADLGVAAPGPWPATALAEHVDRALHEATWRSGPSGASRVQVVGALELRGLTPRRTWFGGLHRRAFPTPRPVPFLVPRSVERALDPVDPLSEARYLFASLLRNALDDDRMASLVISWPATLDGEPLAPSPVLADLLDRPTLDPDNVLGDFLVDENASDGQALARSDLLRAAARDRAWRAVLDPADDAPAQAQSLAHAARAGPVAGPWEGVLGRSFPVSQPMAVTALEAYLRCPTRYAWRHVLGIEAVREWEPELDAMRRGSALHEILDLYVRARADRPLRGCADRDAAAAELHAVAIEVFDRVREEGGVEAALLNEQRRRWLEGLVDGGPAGLLQAWLDHEIDQELDLVPVATEEKVGPFGLGPVTVHGRVDRIDRLAIGGIVVNDYKSGEPPAVSEVERGLAVQPIVYAAALAERYPDEPIAAAWYQVKAPDKLGRKSWVVDPALLPIAGRTKPVVLDAARNEALLGHAAEGARRLLDGVFHTTLATPEEAKCEWCEFRRACRWRPDRAAALLDSDADLQRPLSEPLEAR